MFCLLHDCSCRGCIRRLSEASNTLWVIEIHRVTEFIFQWIKHYRHEIYWKVSHCKYLVLIRSLLRLHNYMKSRHNIYYIKWSWLEIILTFLSTVVCHGLGFSVSTSKSESGSSSRNREKKRTLIFFYLRRDQK